MCDHTNNGGNCQACEQEILANNYTTEDIRRWKDNLNKQLSEDKEPKLVAKFIETSGKKPHKCPVCEGNGRKIVGTMSKEQMTLHSFDDPHHYKDCHTCTGSGIVWG